MKRILTFATLTLIALTMTAQAKAWRGAPYKLHSATLIGDVNGDGAITITDVTMMVAYVLGQQSDDFIAANADVNGDGSITVTDVAETVNIILGGGSHNPPTGCPDGNHPHMIDLGLPSGTKWSCCNEGASKPEDFGGYYPFGAVSSAPSSDQTKELVSSCTYEWTSMNGVTGGQFTGPSGGKIFLPAAGDVLYGEHYGVGSGGHYWSSTPYNEKYADDLYFNSSEVYSSTGWGNRLSEHSVRPVR